MSDQPDSCCCGEDDRPESELACKEKLEEVSFEAGTRPNSPVKTSDVSTTTPTIKPVFPNFKSGGGQRIWRIADELNSKYADELNSKK